MMPCIVLQKRGKTTAVALDGEIFDPEHILRNMLRHQNAPDLPPGSFRERGDESLPDLRVG